MQIDIIDWPRVYIIFIISMYELFIILYYILHEFIIHQFSAPLNNICSTMHVLLHTMDILPTMYVMKYDVYNMCNL